MTSEWHIRIRVGFILASGESHQSSNMRERYCGVLTGDLGHSESCQYPSRKSSTVERGSTQPALEGSWRSTYNALLPLSRNRSHQGMGCMAHLGGRGASRCRACGLSGGCLEETLVQLQNTRHAARVGSPLSPYSHTLISPMRTKY